MNQRERSTTTEPGRCGPPDGNGAAKKSKGLPDIIYYLNSGHLTRVVLNSCCVFVCVCVCAWLLGSPCVTWSLAATLNLGTNHSDASLASGLIHPASNLIDSRSNVHQFPSGGLTCPRLQQSSNCGIVINRIIRRGSVAIEWRRRWRHPPKP